MAYLETIKLVTGDSMPDISVVLRDSNNAAAGFTYDENNSNTWAPIDLSLASQVRMHIRKIGESALLKDILGIIADAPNGNVLFNFNNNAFTEDGLYEAEFEITYQDGGVHTTYDLIKLRVRSEFA